MKSIVDAEGEEYVLKAAFYGAKQAGGFFSYASLKRDVPLKCKYTFAGVPPEVKSIKLFAYPVHFHIEGTPDYPGEKDELEFRDLPIQWQ